MAIKSIHRTYFFILLTLIVGKGDGQWKKSSKDVLQRDIKIYKKITEKIKKEFKDFYGDYSHEPINDYFLEEIDYVESKINKYFDPKIKDKESTDAYRKTNDTRADEHSNAIITKYDDNAPTKEDVSRTINTNVMWPKFDDILLAIGKKYDWKNDRWIKVKAKMKEKETSTSNRLKYNVDHQKHNFKYRIVKLNRAKSRRKIVIAVTAVR